MGETSVTITYGRSETNAKSPLFTSFEEYLAADPSDLPEGRYEYWDGELVPVMAESEFNDAIANYLFLVLTGLGIPFRLIRPHSCEVEVLGWPRTRLPDLTVLDEVHLPLMAKRNMVTRDMPPPRLLAEVVSPGNENSPNYKRDYQAKTQQYAEIGVPEYWLIDPDRAIVSVGLLADGAYQFTQFTGPQTIRSPTFPDLTLTVEQVLNAGDV
jgi:Uma2 family endonuclease